ncbi:MAG: 4-(cytidine 5'-diphospho)-2-C-methyl-D-erythritol kinase [Desulfobulbaceae bacterium]|nr:4-(cytidine 5'-diphospho)-2-C-methyl-D-erythritol kinase [Desulfobulbaceae bacterium]
MRITKSPGRNNTFKRTMAGEILTVSAPAKINLYLKVIGRREDGYHLLATLMQKIRLADTLLLRRSHSGISLTCHGSDLPADEKNIVFRAAQLFFVTMGRRLAAGQPGIDITLNKKIPVAAGLGGGSSDAAATLRGLNQLYDARCSVDELLAMAGRLGADVPQFVVDWPIVWATGIGDRLEPAAPLGDFRILLVNPGSSVSTKWVYEKFALTVGKNLNNLKSLQKKSLAPAGENSVFTTRSIRPEELENDLEMVTAVHFPVIETLKKKLLAGGAAAALMSGSGPSVFGLFPGNRRHQAATCFEELKKEFGNTFLVDPWH